MVTELSGNKFKVWIDPNDEEFVWIYSREDNARIVGNIGPVSLEREYGLNESLSLEQIDDTCLRVIDDIYTSAIDNYCGFTDPSPDGFPMHKYFPQMQLAKGLGEFFAWNFDLYCGGIERPINLNDLIRSFEDYIYDLFGNPCLIYVMYKEYTRDFYGLLWHKPIERDIQLSLWTVYKIDIFNHGEGENNFTLLHELGHIIEAELNKMR